MGAGPLAKLLIVADDFTGAMDSGVQFSMRGASTRVLTSMAKGFAKIPGDVLVFDAETRHLAPKNAYRRVQKALELGVKAGIPRVYIKTDSGLRGNVGASLAGAMDALKLKSLVFAPAFPDMKRITRKGVHYIDGVPVAKSAFGRDPLEPVRFSEVQAIIAKQTDKPVHLREPGEPAEGEGIQLYDAETNEDLDRIVGGADLKLSAGCAGFASALADAMGISGEPMEIPDMPQALFVICGSLHPVTRAQLRTAELSGGFMRVSLSNADRLKSSWPGSRACHEQAAEWMKLAREHKRMILDANDPRAEFINRETMRAFGLPDDVPLYQMEVENEGLSLREAGRILGSCLGGAAVELLNQGLDAVLMCVGGDTLMSLMRSMGVSELTPLLEMERGVVLTSFEFQGKTRYILTKSGGFGEKDLLCRLADRIGARPSEGIQAISRDCDDSGEGFYDWKNWKKFDRI